jgi:hypothetical protein
MTILRTYGKHYDEALASFLQSDPNDGPVYLIEVFYRTEVILADGPSRNGAYATLCYGNLVDVCREQANHDGHPDIYGEYWVMDDEDLSEIMNRHWSFETLEHLTFSRG